MTIDEYLSQIEKEIRESKSIEIVNNRIRLAQEVLDKSNISLQSKNKFWIDLYEKLNELPIISLEQQGGSALSDIILAAKSIIAQKVSKK